MDKRYQVFVSSTYDDLQKERQEVMQALLELDCMPAGMELFPAANDDQWTLIKKVIDECDYYIVILAGRYGSLGSEGISFTEMEYMYAESIKKPIIAFLHKDIGIIPANRSETEPQKREKLKNFREYTQNKMCKFWSTPDELGSVVSRSMIKLMKSTPAIGWIRANDAADPEMSKENLILRKRIEELELELKSVGSKAPSGTENFAQGDDPYTLKFKIILRSGNSYEPNQSILYDVHTTWNQIFKTLLPYCFPECSEDVFDKVIKSKFKKIPLEVNPLLKSHWTVYDNDVITSSVMNVIVQLKALGIIVPSAHKRSTSDNSKYWTLTKYGEDLMARLCAIPKPGMDTAL